MSVLSARKALRPKARHAKPSKAAPALAVGGMTASFGAALAAPATAATEDDFARLRQCESSDNYAANTGNGYYGAYQFDRRTWQGLGYSGLPSDAAPATQDRAAHTLQSERGWQPWPACARRLGLGRDDAPRASRSRVVVIAKTGAAPAFPGHVITTKDVGQARTDVRTWQARMKARGWDLAVDGRYGPQSAHVAARFAAEKRLGGTPGVVDARIWNAAWQLPVT